MDNSVLDALSRQVVQTLTATLPELAPDWWQSLVIEKLSFQQQGFAQQHQYHSLDQLDLAALLRVADRSWYDISRHLGLNIQVRNWLKEAQSLRNR